MPMKKRIWAYKVVVEESIYMTGSLNGLGNVGWELVSVTYDPTRDCHILFFKREVAL